MYRKPVQQSLMNLMMIITLGIDFDEKNIAEKSIN